MESPNIKLFLVRCKNCLLVSTYIRSEDRKRVQDTSLGNTYKYTFVFFNVNSRNLYLIQASCHEFYERYDLLRKFVWQRWIYNFMTSQKTKFLLFFQAGISNYTQNLNGFLWIASFMSWFAKYLLWFIIISNAIRVWVVYVGT